MTSATFETAHVCECGHFRVYHRLPLGGGPPGCRDCDCETFRPAHQAAIASAVPAPPAAPERVVEYDEPKKKAKRAPRVVATSSFVVGGVDLLGFVTEVRRMRRAQRRFLTTRGRRDLDDVRIREPRVDALLEKLADALPAELDPQGELFTQPAVSSYLRQNPSVAEKEAKRHAEREKKASLAAGFDERDAELRGERARAVFFEALRRVR